jgi:hypothetical protein
VCFLPVLNETCSTKPLHKIVNCLHVTGRHIWKLPSEYTSLCVETAMNTSHNICNAPMGTTLWLTLHKHLTLFQQFTWAGYKVARLYLFLLVGLRNVHQVKYFPVHLQAVTEFQTRFESWVWVFCLPSHPTNIPSLLHHRCKTGCW